MTGGGNDTIFFDQRDSIQLQVAMLISTQNKIRQLNRSLQFVNLVQAILVSTSIIHICGEMVRTVVLYDQIVCLIQVADHLLV